MGCPKRHPVRARSAEVVECYPDPHACPAMAKGKSIAAQRRKAMADNKQRWEGKQRSQSA